MIVRPVLVDTGKRSLPDGWRWVRLAEVCELNPGRPALSLSANSPTTFVPMAAVDERRGAIVRPEVKPFGEVQRGYTYFGKGDVLFAKITPCMQNGKHAIACDLIGGIGFGTTEFHVLRPGPTVAAEWIHFFIRQPAILTQATAYFAGVVGQQRVPESYLAELDLPLPPLPEQKRIAAILDQQVAAVECARAAAEAQLEAAKALPAAYLFALFDSPELRRWPLKRLGEILTLRKEVIHPRDRPSGPATFVGLEHIQSLTGKRIGSLPVEMAELTGRKPRFRKGDIVYGYLRPYLNKVWIADFDGLCSVDQYTYSIADGVADPRFIAWFMRSPVFLRRAPVSEAPAWLPRIRIEEVAATNVNLPPLGEQLQIVAMLSAQMASTDQARNTIEDELDTINKLPATLLRRAFNGEL